MPTEDSAIIAEEFDRLRGRVCGLIESWGVPERQERGMIQTFKTLTFSTQKIVQDLIAQDSVEESS